MTEDEVTKLQDLLAEHGGDVDAAMASPDGHLIKRAAAEHPRELVMVIAAGKFDRLAEEQP